MSGFWGRHHKRDADKPEREFRVVIRDWSYVVKARNHSAARVAAAKRHVGTGGPGGFKSAEPGWTGNAFGFLWHRSRAVRSCTLLRGPK